MAFLEDLIDESTLDRDTLIFSGLFSGGASTSMMFTAQTGVDPFELLPAIAVSGGDSSSGSGDWTSENPELSTIGTIATSGSGTYGITTQPPGPNPDDPEILDSNGNTVGYIHKKNVMKISQVQKSAERVYNLSHGNLVGKAISPVIFANNQNIFNAAEALLGNRSPGMMQRMLDVLETVLTDGSENALP